MHPNVQMGAQMATDNSQQPWELILPALAGLSGSIVSLRWMPGETWPTRAANAGCGIAAAIFLGPWACELLEVASLRSTSGVSFGIGCFGVAIADIAVRQARDLKIAELIAERFRK